MRRLMGVVISRGFLMGLSVAIQLGFWALVFTVFQDYQQWLTGAMTLVSFFCAMHIIIQDIYPEHKIPWIIFLFLFPILGGVFFLLFGKHRVSKESRLLHQRVAKKVEAASQFLSQPDLTVLPTDHAHRQVHYLQSIARAPAFENTSVAYLPLGETMLASLVAELKQAQRFIFIETFIIEEGKMWGEIEAVLVEKAKAGVEVRVLYDDLGCLLTLPGNFAKRLKAQGIDCRVFNKMTHLMNANFNNRDHRKICIIDGNVAFNGGINFADEYINHKVIHGHWKDTAVVLRGNGVYGLTILFLSMWELQTGEFTQYEAYAPTLSVPSDGIVQPFGDNPLDGESVGENVYMGVLNTAKKYVYITSPYLIITREMTVSLTNAAKSGVDVRLILPGIPDQKFVNFLSRSYYEPLVKAGVKVYEYTPGFIHAKMFVADDDTAIVGTINLDYRSLDLHFECATMVYGGTVIGDIKADFLATLAVCTQVSYQSILEQKRVGPIRFVALAILRAFSPLL